MERSGKIKIDNFNGQSFELWKLKMEDLVVDKYQWVMVDLGTKLLTMFDEHWYKLDQKEKGKIFSCILYQLLLNV